MKYVFPRFCLVSSEKIHFRSRVKTSCFKNLKNSFLFFSKISHCFGPLDTKITKIFRIMMQGRAQMRLPRLPKDAAQPRNEQNEAARALFWTAICQTIEDNFPSYFPLGFRFCSPKITLSSFQLIYEAFLFTNSTRIKLAEFYSMFFKTFLGVDFLVKIKSWLFSVKAKYLTFSVKVQQLTISVKVKELTFWVKVNSWLLWLKRQTVNFWSRLTKT